MRLTPEFIEAVKDSFQEGLCANEIVYAAYVEYGCRHNHLKYKSEAHFLAGWLQGLPSIVDVPFTYHDIDKLLMETNVVDCIDEIDYDKYWYLYARAVMSLQVRQRFNEF